MSRGACQRDPDLVDIGLCDLNGKSNDNGRCRSLNMFNFPTHTPPPRPTPTS